MSPRGTPARAPIALAFVGSCLLACSSRFVDPIIGDGAPFPAACPKEFVAKFSGASFASVPRVIQNDFTIETWISTTSVPSGINFSAGSALVFSDLEDVQANDFAAGLVNDNFVINVGLPDMTLASTSNVAGGGWIHVAATRIQKSGLVLLFVNGVVEASGIGNTNVLSDAANITLAGRATRNYYSGLLSEVRLWNLARSPAEILSNRHVRLRGNEAGLVGYFPFNERGGAVAHDISKSGSDARFAVPPQWVEVDQPFCAP